MIWDSPWQQVNQEECWEPAGSEDKAKQQKWKGLRQAQSSSGIQPLLTSWGGCNHKVNVNVPATGGIAAKKTRSPNYWRNSSFCRCNPEESGLM